MTEKDLELQELRRELKKVKAENSLLKELIQNLKSCLNHEGKELHIVFRLEEVE